MLKQERLQAIFSGVKVLLRMSQKHTNIELRWFSRQILIKPFAGMRSSMTKMKFPLEIMMNPLRNSPSMICSNKKKTKLRNDDSVRLNLIARQDPS